MLRDSTALMSVDNPRGLAAKDRLIVALDFSDIEEAHKLVEQLAGTVSFFKVGYELFLSAGWPIIEALSNNDLNVFLDLKMDDVEATIENAVRSIANRNLVDFLTVHGSGGTAEAAKRGKTGSDLKILQITLLTSLDGSDLKDLMLVGAGDRYRFRSESEYVEWRARQSLEHGCDGLIASGQNARMLRESFPDREFTLVCPGIRPKEDVTDDHKRPCTPHDAIRDSADYIVVGRPIRNAGDPKAKAEGIIEEIQAGLDDR